MIETAALLLTALAALSVTLLPINGLRLAMSLLLVCFLPGFALIEGLGRRQLSLPERLLLGAATSYGLTIIGGMGIYYLWGRLPLLPLLGLYLLASLIGFGLARYHRVASSLPRSVNPLLIAVLGLSAYFSFYALGYSDFRGDEAEVVLRAVSTIQGQGEPIFSHTKGPAEILLAAAFGGLYGSFGEWAARLPFALSSWLAVCGLYLLGRRLYGPRSALIVAALFAINGWVISHNRTAQYQSLLLMATILAAWSYYRFYQTEEDLYHGLGAFFLAVAVLGHYDGIAPVPAILLLLYYRRSNKRAWLSLIVAGLVGLAFYLPFFVHSLDNAQSHMLRNLGAEQPYNNWDAFYVNGLFYNAIYYVVGIGLILLAGTLYGIHKTVRNPLITVAAGPILLLSWTGILPAWYALLLYLGLMALFLLSGRVSLPTRSVLLWLVWPLGFYLFLVIRPGNHYYVVMPPLLLLVAHLLSRIRWPQPALKWAGVGVLAVLFGLSAWYQQLVFMRTNLEYMLTYPDHRRAIFWSDPRYPFDIRIGWGFPYRLGWQTVSELYRSGQLAGDWYGTDENNSIRWYTMGWPRNPCYPRYFFVTQIGYEEPPLEIPRQTIEEHYSRRGTVRVNDRLRLEMYEFSPFGQAGEPAVYHEPSGRSSPYPYRLWTDTRMLDNYRLYDFTPVVPPIRFKPGVEMLSNLAEAYDDPQIVQINSEAVLLGYHIDTAWAEPGGVVLATLHWRANGSIILPYKVFVHLENERLWAQADDQPACSQAPTYNWRNGDEIVDRHALFLPDDIPPGEYPLQIGLYELQTGQRMDKLDEAGNPAGTSLTLPPVRIRAE